MSGRRRSSTGPRPGWIPGRPSHWVPPPLLRSGFAWCYWRIFYLRELNSWRFPSLEAGGGAWPRGSEGGSTLPDGQPRPGPRHRPGSTRGATSEHLDWTRDGGSHLGQITLGYAQLEDGRDGDEEQGEEADAPAEERRPVGEVVVLVGDRLPIQPEETQDALEQGDGGGGEEN